MGVVLDLFCGPGGWATGARAAGIATVGVELDRDACLTHAAAGHWTIRADVSTFPLGHLHGIEGLIASPPCPDFSLAGKGAGIDGDTGKLMWEVPRWVEALRPRWVACEQVPPALEWWERFAHDFRKLGYRTWCGILNAADYGVPQTRRRAFLLASLERQPRPPEATHGRDPQPTLFGEPLLPWVSMASALGWGITDGPCLTVTGGGTETGGAEPVTHPKRAAAAAAAAAAERATVRSLDLPSPTIRFGHDAAQWQVGSVNTGLWWKKGQDRSVAQQKPASGPAPSLTGKSGDPRWPHTMPATTVAGGGAITARCHHDEGSQGRDPRTTEQVEAGDYEGTQPIKLTIADALILQSFPADYPVQGTKTSQFRQIGNAVPPLLATAILQHLP